jgi:hypothetical protein
MRIRDKLTYANVVASIAVFLALGGGVAVALPGVNSVTADDIRIVERQSGVITVQSGRSLFRQKPCAPGEEAVGGGAQFVTGAGNPNLEHELGIMSSDRSDDGGAWNIRLANNTGSPQRWVVVAECIQGP